MRRWRPSGSSRAPWRWRVFLDAERSLSIPLACILVAAHVVASRIKFEVGAGFTVPTQLVFIPMLFLLPTPLVPLLVAFGSPRRPSRLPARQAPPAAGDHRFRGLVVFARPGAVLVAFGAQTAAHRGLADLRRRARRPVRFDFLVTSSREWFELGRSRWSCFATGRGSAPSTRCLSPIALLAMFTRWTTRSPSARAAGGGTALRFAHERQRGLDSALQLRNAYLGTTILLGDLIEDDDEYTGLHSKTVVSLSLQVADEMGLSPPPAPAHRVRGAAPRRRQDRRLEGDHQQARPV